jgi:hypothetical protein
MTTNKKDQELQCLQRVIEAGKKSRGYTKRIIGMLNGEDVHRTDDERPDFVKFALNTNGGATTVIGIEHFRVDHYSLQKTDGKVASKGAPHEKDMRNVYERWHQQIADTNEVPTDAISDIADLIAKRLCMKKGATYGDFLESFSYSLSKHLNNVDAYRQNIRKLTHEKIEIALLIEVHTEFSELYLNDEKEARKNTSSVMPMFADIVNILESIDTQKVNYIILCLGTMASGDKVDVRAFRTGDIRKQLERQHIKIYEYAGEDYLLAGFQPMHKDISVTPSITPNSDGFDINIRLSLKDLSDELLLDLVHYAAKRAHHAITNRIPYITTLRVQMFMETFAEDLLDWENVPDDEEGWRVRPVLQQFNFNVTEQRMNDFALRWGLTDVDRSKTICRKV